MNNNLLFTLKTDGTLVKDSSSVDTIYQGSSSYFKLSISSKINIDSETTPYIQFRRSDGDQTSYLPMVKSSTNMYYLNMNSDWYFHKSGNLTFNVELRKILSEDEVQVLATSSTNLYIDPTQNYNAPAPLKPSAIDIIEDELNTLDTKIDTTNTNLQEEIDSDISIHNNDDESHPFLKTTKLDKNFNGLPDFGTQTPEDEDLIAINDNGIAKKMKVSLIKNKVESVNGVNPTTGTKNVKITGSDIERDNTTTGTKIDITLNSMENEINIIKETGTFFNLFSDEDDPLDNGFTRNVMERIILLESIANSGTDTFTYYDLLGTVIEEGDILEFVISNAGVTQSLFMSISDNNNNKAFLPTGTSYSTITVGGTEIGYQNVDLRYIEIDIPTTGELDRLGIKAGKTYNIGKLALTPTINDFNNESPLTIDKVYVWKNTTLDEVGGDTGGGEDDPIQL